jgi:heme exporter protein C
LPSAAIPSMGLAHALVFVHVPAAWTSLLVFGAAAALAVAILAGRDPLPSRALAALAPVGALTALLALGTGLAVQRLLGAWWGWDARLVCEMVLLLLFVGAIALRLFLADEPARADRAVAVLVLVGALNVPIIYLSLDWWNTLHERAAASVGRSPALVAAMAATTVAFCVVALAVVARRLHPLASPGSAGGRITESALAGPDPSPPRSNNDW